MVFANVFANAQQTGTSSTGFGGRGWFGWCVGGSGWVMGSCFRAKTCLGDEMREANGGGAARAESESLALVSPGARNAIRAFLIWELVGLLCACLTHERKERLLHTNEHAGAEQPGGDQLLQPPALERVPLGQSQ